MYSILFLAVAAFLCCFGLTPLVRAWSRRWGLMDRPCSRRKHALAVPRTGGIAIAISYLIPVGLLLVLPLNAADKVNVPFVLNLLPAAFVVFGVGLLDDLVGMRPWEKLVGQIVAACMAYSAGVQVTGVAGYLAPQWCSLPITVLWLVACTNAFNLIDGVDGLASGVGLFAACTTLAAALLQNNAALALATAPLVGALLAFLRYNFNPASIFLGDGGSLTIGFALGCFGAIWSQKSATLLGMTAPLIALAVPLLDTSLSVLRRFLTRQPIFGADSNHIHHRLLERGLSPRQVALVLYGMCGLAAGFSLLVTVPGNRFAGLLIVGFCAAVWIGVQLVGYVEFDAARQLFTSGSFRHILNARLYVQVIEHRLVKATTAEEYWEIVRDVAREFRCLEVRMFLIGKVYEHRDDDRKGSRCCTVRLPLGEEQDYLDFQYPVELSVRNAVAISSTFESLQRHLAPGAVASQISSTAPKSGVAVPPIQGMGRHTA